MCPIGTRRTDVDVVARPLATTVGDWLIRSLQDHRWTTFRCAAAFLNSSGSAYFAPALFDFTRRSGTKATVSVGVDSQGTSLEGVQDVWRVLRGIGQFRIVHEGPGGSGSFHPKVYLFENGTHAALLAGSANLTRGGLFTNHELSVLLEFADVHHPALASTRQALDTWQTPSQFCQDVTPKLIQNLHDRGDLPSEPVQRIARRAARAATAGDSGQTRTSNPFGAGPRVSAPPPRPFPPGLSGAPVTPESPTSTARTAPNARSGATAVPAPHLTRLVTEVMPHHNGELFLSKNAVTDDPLFFNHPFAGWTVPKSARNNPYPLLDPAPVVEIVIYDAAGAVLRRKALHLLYVVEYERRHEIRVTIPERLHDHIPPMSILVMTKDPLPQLDYRLEFYPPGTAPAAAAGHLTTKLPSGGSATARHYGWA